LISKALDITVQNFGFQVKLSKDLGIFTLEAIKMKNTLGIVLAMMAGACAEAATIVVTPDNALSLGWYSTGNSGGGSSGPSAEVPYNGEGSLRLTGDRTRYTNGNPFLTGPSTNLGLLSSLTGFGMDWRVDVNTSLGQGANLGPALRLHIIDPGADNTLNAGDFRAELIWEFAENGGSGNTFGQWNLLDTNSSTGTFYRFVGEFQGGGGNTGRSFDAANAQLNLTFSQWLSYALPIQLQGGGAQPNFSSNAFIAAISVGVGSGFGSNYLAYADNVRLTFADQTIYNFEAVPEPGTYVMILAGLGAIVGLRRKR
jgi:hypothetical protein